jgi:hypothetical protein
MVAAPDLPADMREEVELRILDRDALLLRMSNAPTPERRSIGRR